MPWDTYLNTLNEETQREDKQSDNRELKIGLGLSGKRLNNNPGYSHTYFLLFFFSISKLQHRIDKLKSYGNTEVSITRQYGFCFDMVMIRFYQWFVIEQVLNLRFLEDKNSILSEIIITCKSEGMILTRVHRNENWKISQRLITWLS